MRKSIGQVRRLVLQSGPHIGGPRRLLLRARKFLFPLETRALSGATDARTWMPFPKTITIPSPIMTPSPNGANLSQALPLEQGHVSTGVIASKVAGGPDVNEPTLEDSASLQAIHNLLTTVPKLEFSDCSDFNFIESDGGNWPQVLHSAMMISSRTEFLGMTPPEEGEIPSKTRGESSDATCLIGEFMVGSLVIAGSPTTATVMGTKVVSHSPVAISSPIKVGGPLAGPALEVAVGDSSKVACPRDFSESSFPSSGAQVAGGVLPQLSSSEAPPGLSDAFPSRDISWPNLSQGAPMLGTEGALEIFMGAARTIM
ncbi:hypothetical protein Taro_018238 [Colocasia esculenta]|uniref:Uncharacterized protein n=1 Tax=Colocasia esculenta TaxID=4460 RepID=A0A843UVL0_COLES|nr:hypothetical protein [Colocasia esculenta]